MFRFTIRDLLWLTVVVAVATAWWVDRIRLTKRLEVFNRRPYYIEQRIHGGTPLPEEY